MGAKIPSAHLGAAVAGAAAVSAATAVLPLVGPSALAASMAVEALIRPKNQDAPVSRQEHLALLEQQVRLAKEFAIARRIDTAEKVIIEEYYESRGSGKAGAALDPAKRSGKAELSGSGERVTKRVYTFEGVRELSAQEEAQMAEFLRQFTAQPDESSR